MSRLDADAQRVDEFIVTAIDSVPHLESLLLLWTSRPRTWNAEQIAGSLYVEPARAREILDSLIRRGLARRDDGDAMLFCYAARSEEQDALLAAVEREYKQNLIRITRLIHSKAAPGVREFAQAFQFKRKGSE